MFTPRDTPRAPPRVMTIEDAGICFAVLAQRERLIVKFAILAGMRQGDVFAPTPGTSHCQIFGYPAAVYRVARLFEDKFLFSTS